MTRYSPSTLSLMGDIESLVLQYKGGIFKVALFDRWLLVLTGKKYIEELRKFSDDQVSFLHGTAEVAGCSYMSPVFSFSDIRQTLALLYLFGKEVWEPPYHVTIIRSVLTQHIASMFGDIHDEIESAFAELVHVGEDGACFCIRLVVPACRS